MSGPVPGGPPTPPPWGGQVPPGQPYAGPPYAGPPPTGPYGAPPRVPLGGPPWPYPGMGPGYGPPPGSGGPPVPAGQRPVAGPVPPPGAPPHDVPRPHALLMRTRDWAWWRPLLGLLLFTVLYGVAAVVVVVLAVVTGAAPDLALVDLVDPAVLLITNISLIVAIPIVWLCWAVPHGLRIGWSSSVTGRLRRRLLAPLTWRALATLGVVIGLSVLLDLLSGEDVSGPVPGFAWLVVVVLLTTPLQSAAEEYVFRGYLSQAIAGWIGRERAGAVVAGVVTAALFSAAHAPPDFLTFADRFVFGLAASAVVWLTGGLEAAIVLHAVNNVLVFLLAGSIGAGVENDSTGTGPGGADVALTVVGMSAYVLAVAAARRRLHPELLSAALDLRRAVGPSGTPAGPSWPPAGSFPPAPAGPWVHLGSPFPTGPDRGAPPPDERWARSASDLFPHGGRPGPDLGGQRGSGSGGPA